MNETPITVVGRLTADPELRFTPSGVAVCNFTVATNARRFDRATNEWSDLPPAFWRCSVWRQQGEHASESLTKGLEVIVTGSIHVNEFTDKDGNERRSNDINVDAVGPSLKWQTATVQKAARTDSGGPRQAAPAQGDPWGGGSSAYNQPF